MPELKNVTASIKADLMERGISQANAAQMLGICYVGFSRQLKRGFTNVSAQKWGSKFGYNPYFLLTGLGELYSTDETTEVNQLRLAIIEKDKIIKQLTTIIEQQHATIDRLTGK